MQRFLKGAMTLVAALAILSGVGFYVLAYHSTDVQELVCKGHWKNAPSEPETAYIDLTEYRWWLKLFDHLMNGSPGSAGSASVQTDKKAAAILFSDMRRVSDGRLAMYSFHDFDFNERKMGKFKGGYRAANKEITIDFGTGLGVFIGTCDKDARSK